MFSLIDGSQVILFILPCVYGECCSAYHVRCSKAFVKMHTAASTEFWGFPGQPVCLRFWHQQTIIWVNLIIVFPKTALQRKSEVTKVASSFFFFFLNLCWVQGSLKGEGYHHDTRKQLSPSVAKWPFTCTRVVSCFGMEKLPNFKTNGIGIFKGEDG